MKAELRTKQQAISQRHAARVMLIVAMQHLKAGRLREAQTAFRQLLGTDASNATAMHHLGCLEHELGQSDRAVALLSHVLILQPGNAEAHADLARIFQDLRRYDEAVELCRRAITLKPDCAASHIRLGGLLLRQGRHASAEQAYARAIDLQAELGAAHAGRAEALAILGRLSEAEISCDFAMRLSPGLAQCYGAKGLILAKRGRMRDAAAAYQAALKLDPKLGLIHMRLGNILHANGHFDNALTAYGRAVEAEPDCAEFHCNKALALQALGRFDEALAAFSQALDLKPEFAEALTRQGILLNRMRRFEEAIASLQKAVEIAPRNRGAWLNLAGVLKERDRLDEAVEAYRTLLGLSDNPDPAALYDSCHLRRMLCDWDGLERDEQHAIAAIRASNRRVPPFAALAMAASPQDHLALARRHASDFRPTVPPHDHGNAAAHGHIRLGYLSNDFYDHATASLCAELFELHDRTRFEVMAFCYSPEDGSAMRNRLTTSFDRLICIGESDHQTAAQQIANHGIDILIDLKGHTRGARAAILAHRPAPIQVNYLGYPSTMGADFTDYIIADPFVAPMEHQAFFDEKIVHLPNSYQPNDRKRAVASGQTNRRNHGLPDQGFVFCAFNATYKITSQMFAIWMRIMRQISGSVLWLLDTHEAAKANLRQHAAAQGIDEHRLIFAPKISMAEHQARYGLADLFLDNLPVNAHTTASEALWAGVPVITCAGPVFVGRVAGSLLHACRIPELVTNSLTEYEALALHLANAPTLLASLRTRLKQNRLALPLFDTPRYVEHLEAAYIRMVQLHRAGLAPEAFAVADLLAATETQPVMA